VNDSKPAQSQWELVKVAVREAQSRHPPFMEALLADARVASAYRGERHEFRSRLDGVLQALRLMLQTDAFLALAAYRMKARLQALGIPVLPWIAHRLAMVSAQVSIGDAAVLHPGVFIPNGQVVIYGIVEIQSGVILLPWVTVGVMGGGVVGPRIGPWAQIGTGAKVMGDIEVGAGARVGVNAVVPRIGPWVQIGTGAKVMGDIDVGAGARRGQRGRAGRCPAKHDSRRHPGGARRRVITSRTHYLPPRDTRLVHLDSRAESALVSLPLEKA
jgi:serine acetyltransferase